MVFSKIVRPSVYSQKGIMAKDSRVLKNVIAMLRLRLPPSKTAHMLLAPPPGLQPKTKRPNLRYVSSKIRAASPNEICKMKKQT